ncbi:MAG: ATP-dependent DNA helicase [Deltaproteobacteria bacterium]|nr:ATP-dependent DNA helicase [Deltaproteobacteria bacterium]
MPAPSDKLLSILGPTGALAQHLPGYEPRAPQVEMAALVEDALAKNRALLVEAGTGTGKTLAYLVPAAQSGLKVVISTATKNLQEQLRDKDVPLLKQLGLTTNVAFLKGRQNYLCLLRKEQFDAAPLLPVLDEFKHVPVINEWAERTKTGDRAELADVPEGAQILREITSTPDTCTGPKCAHYDRCFVYKARNTAANATMVIVNHHLFFADLALKSSSAGDGGAAVLPNYEAVIFDEAHAVEEVATQHFGWQVSSFRAQELGRDALRTLQQHPSLVHARGFAERLQTEGKDYFEAVVECRPEEEQKFQRQLPERTRGGFGDRRGKRGAFKSEARESEGTWALGPSTLWPAEEERRKLVELLRGFGAAVSVGEPPDELKLLERRAATLAEDLNLFAADPPVAQPEVEDGPPGGLSDEPAEESDIVRWAESRGGSIHLRSAPLDVSALLQDKLYDKLPGAVVYTSATLAVGNQLHYAARTLGLADHEGPLYPTDLSILASPFDYEKNAAIYLPEQMPEPNDPRFVEALVEEIRPLLELTQGRAFILFTSLRNMRAAHALCAGELALSGLQVLLQGERPKAQLLRMFKERESVLFASQSFWEGVDVPGDALSLVVIDKLPFASPGDPLTAARIDRLRAQGQDAFNGWQVPHAAISLKQGFGRLIRTASDRGIVAICDPRVWQKGYGRVFLQTLPKCKIVRNLKDARAFWGE